MSGIREKIKIPEWISRGPGRGSSPVYFIDFRARGIDVKTARGRDEANSRVYGILEKVFPGQPASPPLLKIHPGEPRSRTHLVPGLVRGQADFLRDRGLEPVLGDSTVIYTGNRGCKNNPPGDVSAYMGVVEKNGWDKQSTGMEFVVLDRPVSSAAGVFEFKEEELMKEAASPGSYDRVFVSGGFDAAGTVFNNAHLTLHGMSVMALSVKALTMGCAGESGKKQMHMNLAPEFIKAKCRRCGLCVENCPFGALTGGDEGLPVLIPGKCAGCGECMAVCPAGAVMMSRAGNVTWGRGRDSFLSRLCDFLVSMMNGKWDGLVNIGHLYSITAQCDCMDEVQEPIIGDIGLIVSKNPFAADRLAMELFLMRAGEEGKKFPLKDYPGSFSYVENTYGIITRPDVIEA